MKVFTFFYRKVVIQILTEIIPYLKKIFTVTDSKKVRQIMELSMVRQLSDKLSEYLKLKADFTGFSRTDGINYTRLRALVCGVLT